MDLQVVLDNGIVQLTLSKPGGSITGVKYHGLDNVMEVTNREDGRGYWDLVWKPSARDFGIFQKILGTKFDVVQQDANQVEVSFRTQWNPSNGGKLAPLNIDKRFVMLRGSSGFYTYAIYEHLQGWPDFNLEETRVAFKLRKDRSQKLGYPEAVRLTNPTNAALRGETFLSSHYVGDDILPRVRNGEYWKKVFGPVFIYLNSAPTKSDPKLLWEDAKKQARVEEGSWPYEFPASQDFQKSEQRGSVSGRLLVVRFNDPIVQPSHFTTGLIGRDNSIARHGIHGLYWLFSIDVDSSWLLEGDNTIFLTQTRFVMLRGSSGFYTYAIYEHLQGWPDFNLGETRVAFKLRKDKFHYMAVADNRQRIMPMADDRRDGRADKLGYPEAVRLTDPTNAALRGEVDDKHQYSSENKDSMVHGWISSDPPIGFWLITPSNEFKTGGPLKQDLTSHVGPTALAVSASVTSKIFRLPLKPDSFMFVSSHYSGVDTVPKFRNGEYWKKVFGPVFIYLNSASEKLDTKLLWEDAQKQMQVEVEKWPYEFPASEDFHRSEQRGSVSGRLLVLDKHISKEYINGNAAFVGLASPGEAGSWQRESKGYQFWVRADVEGNFFIKNVRTGVYNLYAWVPGFIGDYKSSVNITVTSGNHINLGRLVYNPPRDGPTLWEIGIPDRSAAEFFVPDPDPKYTNRPYVDHSDRFRQYGLWERYADLCPDGDLIYTIGVSDYRKDWFYAQVTRKDGQGSHQATTWQIRFRLDRVHPNGTYKLRVGLAAAHLSELQVRFNNPRVQPADFTTRLIGRDNSIARQGIHGLYWLFSIDVESSRLHEGDNIIFLAQTRCQSPFQGVMYDYIRMEAPAGTVASTDVEVEKWPYEFPASEDFHRSEQRGSVSGRLLVLDKHISKEYINGNAAFVGLASPGEAGSWQRESKGYQFWVRADVEGNFFIKNVRTGVYNLYAWVPGFIGDYRSSVNITITPGNHINLGSLVYNPPRDGPTLWEIGIPDRSAAEFFVPDPDPKYTNGLYVDHSDRFRQYGLWERYADLYPDGDLIYTIGVSDYCKDWFYAQVTRKDGQGSYQATTWQIRFRLDRVHPNGTYKLRVALAAAHLSELQVRFNNPRVQPADFTTRLIGRDNSIARQGIHGLYWLFSIDVESSRLHEGDNIIFLAQTRCHSPFQGVMYDYIRMEAPAGTVASTDGVADFRLCHVH
ncbi:Rhamnogalacturonate lyase [Musa troglodytarum]|uniref:rhamnogalacturonan endolyase n=1 Tax=Musa troglodytarum TaxID=320322 RepID=A0A9E7JA86_9LILI|nr:Rhamnogalacturonate lyase [Musa troglodytarum]